MAPQRPHEVRREASKLSTQKCFENIGAQVTAVIGAQVTVSYDIQDSLKFQDGLLNAMHISAAIVLCNYLHMANFFFFTLDSS